MTRIEDNSAYSDQIQEMTPHFLDGVHPLVSPESDVRPQIMRAGRMRVGVGTMQGYDFIGQSSMRAAPGEAERAGKARCEARWGPWGRPLVGRGV